MWSQFFVERYAHEKHEAHLSEAAHDRLPRDLRANGHPSQGRLLHVPTAETGGAVVLLVLATLLSVGLTGAVERPTTPARVVEVSAVRPVASFAHVVDRWYEEPEAKLAAGSSFAHVVDRSYTDELWFFGP